MITSEFLIKALFALAACAAAPLIVLWIAFTCREIRQAHTLARLRRLHATDHNGANSTV